MIFNDDKIVDLDLNATYLQVIKKDNYEFSMMEISRLSQYRLESVELSPVLRKVRKLIEGLGDYLDIREEDVVKLDANVKDCVEIRFAARRDIKVNLYVESKKAPIEGISEPDYDEDEMYFTYKIDNRRMIMHGTMDKMIEKLKAVLHDT